MAQLVPDTGDEKESLQVSLDRHRDAVLWKLEGLEDADLRRAMLPSGNTLLGLVKHLATWEYAWICRTFGPPTEPLPIDEGDYDADVRVNPQESTAAILAFYERARTAADQVISEVGAWHGDGEQEIAGDEAERAGYRRSSLLSRRSRARGGLACPAAAGAGR